MSVGRFRGFWQSAVIRMLIWMQFSIVTCTAGKALGGSSTSTGIRSFFEKGIINEEEYNQLKQACENLNSSPDAYAMMTFVMACGKKPEVSSGTA
ncbi:hypothetical protein [Paenibacillus sp. DMB5]|uniref:hypothetical protein n=1 Tax=Paenibacillus sp. DMB5 TaxID=1780103 RepID=UPI00076C9CC0|nr:hypothetical protein [Paenibacillus sp. DMB5]KUP23254.1 hypothetical protein AWJ19_22055 [Paenibacillus sp. DMB5]